MDLLEPVSVTILNVYIFGNIDSLSTSIAENFIKMYIFNDFLEARRDQCTGYWNNMGMAASKVAKRNRYS